MAKLHISITRKEDDLGFGVVHSGIFDFGEKLYGGAFGNIDELRRHLLELLDRIDANDEKCYQELDALR